MRFIKSDLLTLLVSLFIFAGCNNPTGIGLDVDANSTLNSLIVDTTTVITKLQKQDSVISNYTTRSVLGNFKDPVFGETTASLALGLTMPSVNFSFGNTPTLDSAVLVLPYTSFYGDSINTNYTIEVRQLNETVYNESSKTYYSNKKWLVKSTLLASKSISAAYRDSIILQDIVVGKKDTIKKVPGQLRIKLDPNFVINNIINLDSINKVSNLAFNNFLKGLYVSVNKTTSTNRGGLFSLDTYTQGASRLDIFYKNTNSTNGKDTLKNTFNINGISGSAATELIWDMTGTVVKTELESPSKSNNLLYFKGLGSTQVKVEFPYLAKLKALGTNVTINRAELIFTIKSGTETPYAPLPRLRVYRWDIANRPQFVPDESSNDPRFIGAGFVGGFYSSPTKTYVINLTGYIQDLMSGRTKNYGTFISPSDTNAANVFNSLGRSVTGGGINPDYKVKLKVFYTDQK